MSQPPAEEIRRTFAAAWGEIGAAWGVAPSTAAVQGYFLVHGGPLTEPQIRRALELSHRAASMALAECEAWGLVERGEPLRRAGQRGPAATAYRVVGDHWEWFRRVARARKEREADPAIPLIERCVRLARDAAVGQPDPELADLHDRLSGLLRFVQLFNRGVGAFVDAEPADTARLFAILGALDDATLQRLIDLGGFLSADEVAKALRAVARLSPGAVRRLVAIAGTPGLVRLIGAR
jgi:Predicted transcriptional regulators